MPTPKRRDQTALRDKLAEDIHARHAPIAERFTKLGAPEYAEECQARLAALVAGKPVQIEAWKLADALWDLGDRAAARQIEDDAAAMYVVNPDGTYDPATAEEGRAP
jgi:hypothetical protein